MLEQEISSNVITENPAEIFLNLATLYKPNPSSDLELNDLIEAKTLLVAEHDGHNLASNLLGKDPKSDRPPLYREFSGYGGQQAVWMGKWKGVRQKMIRKGKNHDPLKIELFDLSKDESESEDLATKHPNVVQQIKEIMEKEHIPSQYFPIKVID